MSQSASQGIFWRPSWQPKNFSNVSSGNEWESSVGAGPAGREDRPHDALERSSVDQVSPAKGFSDVLVGAPKLFSDAYVEAERNLPTSQLTPQGIFRRLSWPRRCPKEFRLNLPASLLMPQNDFRSLSRRHKRSSDVAPQGIFSCPSQHWKKWASGRYFEDLYKL